jgi:hypothetical protein
MCRHPPYLLQNKLRGEYLLTLLEFLVTKKHNFINFGGSLTLTSGSIALKLGLGAAIGGALNVGVIILIKGFAADFFEKKIRVNVIVLELVKIKL